MLQMLNRLFRYIQLVSFGIVATLSIYTVQVVPEEQSVKVLLLVVTIAAFINVGISSVAMNVIDSVSKDEE